MKRKRSFFYFLSFFFLSVNLVSCDLKVKTPLIYGYLDGHKENITYQELVNKQDHLDNFLLFVTPEANCTCWTSFHNNVLTPFIKEHHLYIYTINYRDFFSKTNEPLHTFKIPINPGHQTLALFKDGKLKVEREYKSEHRLWYESEAFSNYLFELIELPTIYEVNLNKLNSLINEKEKVNIIYYDNQEIESLYLKTTFLKEYSFNISKEDSLYLINTNTKGIKLDDNEEFSETLWSNFITTHSLDFYLDNVLPIVQHYNNQTLIEQSVYLNDVLSNESVNNEHEIINTYFTNQRFLELNFLSGRENYNLLGKIVPLNQTFESQGVIKWQFEYAKEYHNYYLKSFFDFYL